MKYLFSFFLGCLLILTFAPFHQEWLAIICFATFYAVVQSSQVFKNFLTGFSFGLGFFGFGVSWVFISIHVYGQTPIWLSTIFTFLFVAVLALFPAFTAMLFAWLFKNGRVINNILGFSTLYISIECIRSYIFTGFPWLLIGDSQVHSFLSGYMPVFGVYGTGLIVVLLGAAFYELIKNIWQRNFITKINIILIFILLSILTPAYFLKNKNWTQPFGKPISFALIQGNVEQQLKWDPQVALEIIEKYEELTDEYWDKQLIIWPEAAFPIPLPEGNPWINELNKEAKKAKTNLLIGVVQQSPNQFYYYNQLLGLGQLQGSYNKQHLVPFGEYVPLENILRGLIQFFNLPMSFITAGSSNQQLLQVQQAKIAAFVCYEIAYANLVARTMPDANFLVIASNDAWFGRSFAAAQHLQIAQARALQTGRPALFVANTGITAAISARGDIVQQAPVFEDYVLTGMIQPQQGMTPWMLLGNANIILAIVILLLLCGVRSYFGRDN